MGAVVILATVFLDKNMSLPASSSIPSTMNASITEKIYPNMGHTTNEDEIKH
jgi:hypothetical protein